MSTLNHVDAREPAQHRFSRAIAISMIALVMMLDALPAFGVIEEIVVQARKRGESLQDTPVVVSALSKEVIDAFAVTDLEDISDLVPGLTLDIHAGINPTLNLRGIQSDAVNQTIESSIAVNIDGVQSSSPFLLRVAQFDVASVEVLKGPQSLFFGKNSPGGIIAIRTGNPTDEFTVDIEAGYEFEGERHWTEAFVSGPLGERFGYRLGGRYTESDKGYWVNEASNAGREYGPQFEETLLRGVLSYEGDSFDAIAKVTTASYEAGQNLFSQLAHCELIESIVPGLVASLNPTTDCDLNETFVLEHSGAVDDLIQPNYPAGLERPSADYETTLFSLEANWTINESLTLTSVTGFSELDNTRAIAYFNYDTGVGSTFGALLYDDHKVFSQELRLTGEADNFRYMLGAFYDERDITTEQGGQALTTFLAPFMETGQDTDSWSVFAQVEIDFAERWSWSIGGRYLEETKEYRGRLLQDSPTLTTVSVGDPFLPTDPKLDIDDFSPETTLTFRPTDDIMLFANYKEGFKSGGFNQSFVELPIQQELSNLGIPFSLSFLPEEVEGFEIGGKTQWLNNTLQINFAAFSYEYRDLQLSAVNPDTLTSETLNAGEAKVEGFEADLLYLVPSVEGLVLTSSIAFQDSRYEDYVGECNPSQRASNLPATMSPVAGQFPGCDIDRNGDGVPDGQQRAGDPLLRAPDWVVVFGFNYERSVFDGIGFRTSWGATWTDDYFASSYGDPRGLQEDHWVVNGSLGLFAEDGAWSADLIVRNATDEQWQITAVGLPGTTDFGGPLITSVGNPREVMLRLKFSPTAFMK